MVLAAKVADGVAQMGDTLFDSAFEKLRECTFRGINSRGFAVVIYASQQDDIEFCLTEQLFLTKSNALNKRLEFARSECLRLDDLSRAAVKQVEKIVSMLKEIQREEKAGAK